MSKITVHLRGHRRPRKGYQNDNGDFFVAGRLIEACFIRCIVLGWA